jgi:hypothetical protein
MEYKCTLACVAEEAGYRSLDTFGRKSNYFLVKIANIRIAGPLIMDATSDFRCTTRHSVHSRNEH